MNGLGPKTYSSNLVGVHADTEMRIRTSALAGSREVTVAFATDPVKKIPRKLRLGFRRQATGLVFARPCARHMPHAWGNIRLRHSRLTVEGTAACATQQEISFAARLHGSGVRQQAGIPRFAENSHLLNA